MQIKKTILEDATEPITLAEAKAWLKATDYTEDDSLVTSLITAVREQVEQFTGLSLIASEIVYFNDEIPTEIELPFPEHDEITEVKINGEVSQSYTKTGLTQLIVYPSKTYVSTEAESGMKITYKTLGNCNQAIKSAMLKEIDERYRNRGNTFEGSISQLSNNTYALLAQFCIV